MAEEKIQLEEFQAFLLKKKTPREKVKNYLKEITRFLQYLEENNESINSFSYGRLIEYADELASKDKEAATTLIVGLWSYFPFINKNNYMEELIDIAESSNAMDNLYQRIAEWHDEEIRDEIFKDIEIPPLGADPVKKPSVTKVVMKRLEKTLGEEKTIELLRPCLHGRPPLGNDKEEFLKIADLDKFLTKKFQDFIKQVKKHRDDGTAMFAQLVDDEVVQYVEKTPTMGTGIRDKNKIIVTKIPYQIKKFLNTKDDNKKRYYVCYCPWVRGAIKDGTEKEMSSNFCYCSGGFFKQYWDKIFDESVEIEPLETALWGDSICKFAIKIPKEI
ncbi:hypothetical protein EU523_01920, partial [Candidatus Heimdallarchaeota archaeon]